MSSVIVIRHPKENLRKNTLRPLEGRADFRFLCAREGFSYDASSQVVLHPEGELLSAADAGFPLVILDSTWRLLPRLAACLRGKPVYRRLPPVISAYPRKSALVPHPENGLCSVEAVYLAKRILGEDEPNLLDHYPWRENFLANVDEALAAP